MAQHQLLAVNASYHLCIAMLLLYRHHKQDVNPSGQASAAFFALRMVMMSLQRRTAAKKKDTTMSQITSFVNAENACAGKPQAPQLGNMQVPCSFWLQPWLAGIIRPMATSSCLAWHMQTEAYLPKTQRVGGDRRGDRQKRPGACRQRFQHQPCESSPGYSALLVTWLW